MPSRQPLLIDPYLAEITSLVQENGMLVLSAPPGAGKTTRIPTALLDSGVLPNGQIVVLQPRRLAARAIAARIAYERGCRVGEEVGYQIRFDNKTSKNTKIRIVTEGILVRQLQSNPFLDGVGAVILDEFHERSIHSDLVIAMLREIRTEVRPDLVLIVMSATLDVDPIVRFMDNPRRFVVEGRRFPLEIRYADDMPSESMVQRVVRATTRILAEFNERSIAGHVLCFLPGVAEIQRTIAALREADPPGAPLLLPLHGRQTADEQDLALRQSQVRKVIVATNIAETSLTIDGVVAVVDSGWEKTNRYDPRTGIDHLELGRISRAAADQRAGRAARNQAGVAVRCWSKGEQAGLVHFSTPEVRRVDLTSTVLEIVNWGCPNPARFGWFDPPSPDSLGRATELARLLGAISSSDGNITKLGRDIIHLPVHPRLGVMLIEAKNRGLGKQCAYVAALLSEYASRPADSPKKPEERVTRDLLALVEHAKADRSTWGHRVAQVAQQLSEMVDDGFHAEVATGKSCVSSSICVDQNEEIRRLVLRAYPDRVAKRRHTVGPGAVMVGGHGVLISLASEAPDDSYFVAIALQRHSSADGRRTDPHVLIACSVEANWLGEELPHAIAVESTIEFSKERNAVVCIERTCFLDLCLEERTVPAPIGGMTAEVLGPVAIERIDEIAPLVGNLGGFVRRAEWLRRALPELGFPSVLAHRTQLVAAAAGHCRSILELTQQNWLGPIRGCLSYQQVASLDFLAPEHYTNGAGRKVVIAYPDPSDTNDSVELPAPRLAVKLQEMFGVHATPSVGNGKFPLLLELLAPNGRPVQVTQDLGSFWKTTYSEVRKELRGKYPKHHWPDDPLAASWRPPGHNRRP